MSQRDAATVGTEHSVTPWPANGYTRRYRLRDVVEVTGHIGTCPLLRFIGKAEHVVDHFGEKLNERHVHQALDTLYMRHSLRPAFAMLACETAGRDAAYTLFIEAPDVADDTLLGAANDLDELLSDNFHYAYCRKLGQLRQLRVFRIAQGGIKTYQAVCWSRGQRAGDIKPMVLDRWTGWAGAFAGQLIHQPV